MRKGKERINIPRQFQGSHRNLRKNSLISLIRSCICVVPTNIYSFWIFNRHDFMPQVQFSLMRLTRSAVSEVLTVNMRPVDELSLSCSYRWMVSAFNLWKEKKAVSILFCHLSISSRVKSEASTSFHRKSLIIHTKMQQQAQRSKCFFPVLVKTLASKNVAIEPSHETR